MSISKTISLFCRDDIQKIENYDAAIRDTEKVWHCHHRLECTLDGSPAVSRADLIRHGMYYNRPYFELIFLSPGAHSETHYPTKSKTAPKITLYIDQKYEDKILYLKLTQTVTAFFESCLDKLEIGDNDKPGKQSTLCKK